MARITVVNSYPAFLEMMDAMLDSAGHQVTGFDGQETSIEQIRETRPDILIIDVAVKGEVTTGWDVLALARADSDLRSVPIVVCTADISQTHERLEELNSLGNIRVLDKPFSAEELDGVIRPLLDGKGPSPS
jgi:CheY-like chemotaxis protein